MKLETYTVKQEEGDSITTCFMADIRPEGKFTMMKMTIYHLSPA